MAGGVRDVYEGELYDGMLPKVLEGLQNGFQLFVRMMFSMR